MGCVTLFYRYYKRFSSSEISGLIREDHVFLRNTRLSWQAHLYVVEWPFNRTIPYGQNMFFSRTVRMWITRRETSTIYRKLITGIHK